MSTTPYTILLVEDESNDALLLERAFRRANLSPNLKVVTDGEQAVEYLEGKGKFSDRAEFPIPSLLLLDLKLPRRSGLEVLEWIRQQDTFKEMPVIVLTSSRHTADIDKAYDLGATSYMAKPEGNFDELAEMVKKLG